LNLAFKAAQLIAPDRAECFLYRLRYAVVVETRPATKRDELIRVAALTGLDTELFSRALGSAKTREALERDLRFTASLGVHSLPATLVQYGNSAMMLSGMGDFHEHAQAIMRVSNGAVVPQKPAFSPEALSALLHRHPLMSSQELRAAFALDEAQARDAARALEERGELSIVEVPRGWFIQLKAK
ncbi:MAG: DsbA family protein, partial [Pyramidobacter sp.]|nr:DsbA family protein [Pyramidobacter sp.]